MFSKSTTLTELLIALSLCGLIIMAVAVVDITSRNLFHAASRESRVQDEAKLAMEHIVKNVQLGIGDVVNPGFTIYDNGSPQSSGSRIQVNLDDNNDGRFIGSPPDKIIEYSYQGASNYSIIYNDGVNPAEPIAAGTIESVTYSFNSNTPNLVELIIISRRDPSQSESLDNPETTLTSSIVLRAMPCY